MKALIRAEGSFSLELLSSGKADKIAYNAHCDREKADAVATRNSFGKIVYYHCNKE